MEGNDFATSIHICLTAKMFEEKALELGLQMVYTLNYNAYNNQIKIMNNITSCLIIILKELKCLLLYKCIKYNKEA